MLAVSAVATVTYNKASSELIESASDNLYALMELRRDELADYYESVRDGTLFWARNPFLRPALPAFIEAWNEQGEAGRPRCNGSMVMVSERASAVRVPRLPCDTE